jgi:hypothetical protein
LPGQFSLFRVLADGQRNLRDRSDTPLPRTEQPLSARCNGLFLQSVRCVRREYRIRAVTYSGSQWRDAFARTPVLPEATPVGSLSAHSCRSVIRPYAALARPRSARAAFSHGATATGQTGRRCWPILRRKTRSRKNWEKRLGVKDAHTYGARRPDCHCRLSDRRRCVDRLECRPRRQQSAVA